MKNKLLTIISLLIFGSTFSQNKQIIETSDIDHFWIAYDQLNGTKNKTDSIQIIQTEYLDKASVYFKEFIRLRNFTAVEYVGLLGKYPKFWKSIRKETENIKNRKPEIEEILVQYETAIPNFKRPNVCFAIGCLRIGGTVSENLVLIGTEIAASTSETDKTELSPWLKTVIGTSGDIVAMISHETIHTQQKGGSLRDLVAHSINEGVADFLSERISGMKIDKVAFSYGLKNDCDLRKEFLSDYSKNKTNLSNWLFNGNKSANRPADLGYYLGYKIAEDFYNLTKDKKKAVSHLLDRKKYKTIFQKSEYMKKRCN